MDWEHVFRNFCFPLNFILFVLSAYPVKLDRTMSDRLICHNLYLVRLVCLSSVAGASAWTGL